MDFLDIMRRYGYRKGSPQYDLYDLQIEEVSSVDEGDNPGAQVVLFKRAGDVDQAAAPEISEEGAAALSDEEIERIVSEVIEEEVRTSRSSTTTYGADGSTRTDTTTHREERMSVTTMSKRSDVMAVATAEARELQKTRPELSLPAARAEIWKKRPDLANRFNELPFESPPATQAAPVLKGGPAYQEATREAEDLMQRYPDRHKSVTSARLEIYKIRPDLADRAERELRGRG